MDRSKAGEKIQAQIAEGEAMALEQPRSHTELDALRAKRRIWSDYNHELLNQMFTTDSVAEEYSEFVGGFVTMDSSFYQDVEAFRSTLGTHLTRLKSVFRRLELFPLEPSVMTPPTTTKALKRGVAHGADNGVFLVHGHNNEAKETVARFLERLGLVVTILHEQPDKGRTIVEKFEDHASVGFAVVLLTSDDVGATRKAPEQLSPRARQNVVLELGYFLGKLGRAHVCALREEDVDIPSDLSGLLYVPLDGSGAWKLRLALEIKASGVAVDLNRVA
jgi:hypothetical protein